MRRDKGLISPTKLAPEELVGSSAGISMPRCRAHPALAKNKKQLDSERVARGWHPGSTIRYGRPARVRYRPDNPATNPHGVNFIMPEWVVCPSAFIRMRSRTAALS